MMFLQRVHKPELQRFFSSHVADTFPSRSACRAGKGAQVRTF